MSWKAEAKGSGVTQGHGSPGSRSVGRSPAHGRPGSELLEVKSKFDAEFRRFSIPKNTRPTYEEFRATVERLHGLQETPFTLCYTDVAGDLLPITNDNNFWKALESARPVLRL